MAKPKKVSIEQVGTNWVTRCGSKYYHEVSVLLRTRKQYICLLKNTHEHYIITNEFPKTEVMETEPVMVDNKAFVAIVPEQGEGLRDEPIEATPILDASTFDKLESSQEYIPKDLDFKAVCKSIDSALDYPADEETGEIKNLGQEVDEIVELNFNTNRTEEMKHSEAVQQVTVETSTEQIPYTAKVEDSPQQANNTNPLKTETMENKAETKTATATPQQPTVEAKKPNKILRVGALGLGYGVVSVTAPGHFIFKSAGDICYAIANGFATVEATAHMKLGILPEEVEFMDGTKLPITKDLVKLGINQRTIKAQGFCLYPITATASLFKKKEVQPVTPLTNVQPV